MLTLRGTDEHYRCLTIISILPDEVLLEIFDIYHEEDGDNNGYFGWNWDILVHVCRKWRQVVYASPHRLGLKIICSPGTPVKKDLDIWPALPIEIYYSFCGITTDDQDNIIAALKHLDRVCEVSFDVTDSKLEKISTAMRQTFPMLARLHIDSLVDSDNSPVLPADFLGGSAPRLHDIYLRGISFPALPTLLLSTSDLVTFDLRHVPPSGYISPEAMVVGLAALPRLERFTVGFQSAVSRPDRIHPSPVSQTVLPALTIFRFVGASEYLEVLAARIDAPQLAKIEIRYLNQPVDFRVAQLSRFIYRSMGAKLARLKYARVSFHSGWVTLDVSHSAGRHLGQLATTLSCQRIDWQVSHMAQTLSQLSTTISLSAAVNVKLQIEQWWVGPTDVMEDVDLRLLLLQFPTMQTLHVSWGLGKHVALALEHMVAGEFPSLYLIFLADQPASSVQKFVTARKFSGRPVTVVDTETKFYEKVKSYANK